MGLKLVRKFHKLSWFLSENIWPEHFEKVHTKNNFWSKILLQVVKNCIENASFWELAFVKFWHSERKQKKTFFSIFIMIMLYFYDDYFVIIFLINNFSATIEIINRKKIIIAKNSDILFTFKLLNWWRWYSW